MKRARTFLLNTLGSVTRHGVLLLLAVIFIGPFFYVGLTSLQETWSLFTTVMGLRATLTFGNYHDLLKNTLYPRWMINSLVVAGGVTAIKLVIDPLSGYAFAKRKFPGKEALFLLLLSTQMIPWSVTLLPTFLMMRGMHLVDTYPALILPALASPVGIFLMRQFIQTLPRELEDSARIDGCSEFGTFWRIIYPLCRPGLAVLGIYIFLVQWNSFVWPYIATTSDEMRTIPVGLTSFNAQFMTNWGMLMAGSVLSILPLLIVFLCFQRQFISGLTVGAVKG